MKIIAALVVLLNVVTALVPLLDVNKGTVLEDRYIFVFHDDTTYQQRDAYMTKVHASLEGSQKGYQVIDRYDIGTFHGFAASLSQELLAVHLQQEKVFKYIAADQEVTIASCSSQHGADWGLDRIDERAIDLNGVYNYATTAGTGVDAYIVDTGILITHNEFVGRATWGANYADATNDDCNGHGTHVAGTVGGTTYGVAKNVHLIAVKVLGCSGSGSWAGVISGIQYVATQAGITKKPSVANMSLGGGLYTALNDAVAAAVATGVTFVVAAGNNNGDACSFSPASTPTAISVGATSVSGASGSEVDSRAYFSNYGTCVDVLAPGDIIKSAYIGGNTVTRSLSGTSMASPHVCGVAALFLSANPTATPADVLHNLVSNATPGVISMGCTATACNQTPNLLLHTNCAAI